MDEVDKIIIHSLKYVGCGIEEDIQSLGQFSTDLVVEAAVRCLEIIQPGHGIPMTLPQNVAARFHVSTSIAETCKDLGYNGEVGYQTFLYANVNEVRRVFMFLIEKLPKETDKSVIESVEPFMRLKNEIGKVIREQLSQRLKPSQSLNVPFLSVPLETGITLPGQKMDCSPQEWKEYCVNELPFLTEQIGPPFLIPSIIALNAKGLIEKNGCKVRTVTSRNEVPSKSKSRIHGLKSSNVGESDTWLGIREKVLFSPTSPKKSQTKEEKTEVVNEEQNEEDQVEKEHKEIEELRSRLEELQDSIKTISSQIAQVNREYKSEAVSMKEKVKDFEVRRKALELLPESEENIGKLEEVIETATQRLLALATQWEKHRQPLINRLRESRKTISSKAREVEKRQELQEKLDSLNKQIALKQSTRVKMEEELAKLPKDLNRSAYTRRIMEIIGNIKKQKDEIDKILRDTKELQKDINTVMGRVERSFTVTKDIILPNAKKDEASRRAYKLLFTLHTDFSDIVNMVQETGSIVREIKELEEQIDIESSKNVRANLERITADLQQMKMESTALTKQLKGT